VTAGRSEIDTPTLGAAGLPICRATRACHIAAEALALLALVPLAAAIVGSLRTAGPESGYVYWWGTARGWESLARTLAVAAPAGAMAVVLAWVLVESAVRLSARWAAAAVLASCLPLLVPSSLLATAWIVALGKQGVITTSWLGGAGGAFAPDLYSVPGAAAVTALRYFGIAAVVLLYARLRREREWPAARVFALPRLAAAWRLHLRPAARPALAAWLLVTLFSMNDHIIPGMLLVSTYGTQVLIQYSALLDPAGAAALAAPPAAVGAAMMAVAVLAGRDLWSAPAGAPAPADRPRGFGRRALAALTAATVLALALAVPVAVLAARTESWVAVATALAGARDQAWQTLYVACAGAALAAAAAAILAHQWAACHRAGVRSAVPLVLVNLTVPPSLLGIGMIELFQDAPPAVRDSSAPLVLGYAARFLPVVVLLLYSFWRHESADARLAARVHGVPAWRSAWSIVWPPRRAAVAGAALLAAVLMATDLETSILLAPPGGSTLGVRLYTLIHTAPDAMVSALAVGILVAAAPAILLLAVIAMLGRAGKAGRT